MAGFEYLLQRELTALAEELAVGCVMTVGEEKTSPQSFSVLFFGLVIKLMKDRLSGEKSNFDLVLIGIHRYMRLKEMTKASNFYTF